MNSPVQLPRANIGLIPLTVGQTFYRFCFKGLETDGPDFHIFPAEDCTGATDRHDSAPSLPAVPRGGCGWQASHGSVAPHWRSSIIWESGADPRSPLYGPPRSELSRRTRGLPDPSSHSELYRPPVPPGGLGTRRGLSPAGLCGPRLR